MSDITVTDEAGHSHILCEGEEDSGIIYYRPNRHNRIMLQLKKNQPVVFESNKRFTVLSWDGIVFRTRRANQTNIIS